MCRLPEGGGVSQAFLVRLSKTSLRYSCRLCCFTDDPHQFPCGHSYCFGCINCLRNHNNYSCPECRREFTNSTDLVRNYKLAGVANAFRENKRDNRGTTVVDGSSISGGVSWIQLMFLLTTVTILIKLYTLWLSTEEESGIKPPSSGTPDQDDSSLLSLATLAWAVVFPLRLLLQLLYLPFWVIWLCASMLLSLAYWCVELIWSGLFLIIGMLCSATYTVVNIVVYVCGLLCVLNWIGNIRQGGEGGPRFRTV
ncbi:hypothetical protein DPEC_G00027770 [Dallia pectoralis]|uniref:Uncharacterized protein n=1 Tax=Dallia pectoralis TaxID=75939 RepID=A0ACC2HHU7_DALPE|nr:hypothetical protein DPEC_G00027770 [Dallia pectoralis]